MNSLYFSEGKGKNIEIDNVKYLNRELKLKLNYRWLTMELKLKALMIFLKTLMIWIYR